MTLVYMVFVTSLLSSLGVATFWVLGARSSFHERTPIRCFECRTLCYPPCTCEKEVRVPRAVARRLP